MTEVLMVPALKEQLNITGTAHDLKLANIAIRAEAILFNYMGYDDLADWYLTHGEIYPDVIEQAMLLCGQALYEHTDPLSAEIRSLVRRYRTFALA